MRPALGALACLLLLAGCGYPAVAGTDNAPVATTVKTLPSAAPGTDDFSEGAGRTPVTLPDGLQYVDIAVGSGAVAHKNDQLSMQYTGWTTDAKKFDSSRDRGQPFDVTIGQGQVIPGWDEGIPGMKVGGRRRLTIPPALAYGAQGQPQGGIPPNATLVFIVELVSVSPGASPSPSPSP